MALRYTHSEKYESDWFVSLSKDAKLMYYYLNDKCDHGGFCEISFRNIEFYLQIQKEEAQNALIELESQIIWADDKTLVWLKDFLVNQGNYPLNKYNGAHRGIIKKIKYYRPNFKLNWDSFKNLTCQHKNRDFEVKTETLEEHLNANPKFVMSEFKEIDES